MKKLCTFFAAFLITISPVTASIEQDSTGSYGLTEVPKFVLDIFENVTSGADSINRALGEFTERQFARLKSGLLGDINHVKNHMNSSRNSLNEGIPESKEIPGQAPQPGEPSLSRISANNYQISVLIKKSADGSTVFVVSILHKGKNGEIFHKEIIIDFEDSVLL